MSGEREEKRAGGSERSSNGTGARKGDAARHRTPDRTRREHASVTPADRGVEGTKACARVKERGRDGERSERGARGRWQADGRKGRVVSTLGTSSSCAQSRIRRSRLEPRASSLSLARATDDTNFRRAPFRFFPLSLSLYNLLFRASSSYSIVLPFPLAVDHAFSLTRH